MTIFAYVQPQNFPDFQIFEGAILCKKNSNFLAPATSEGLSELRFLVLDFLFLLIDRENCYITP